ncbi:MAG: beta-ketoacyl synthase chain length factor [Thioalkalivibrio sp.]
MKAMGLYGIGLLGPGLADFESARALLAGDAPYTQAPVQVPPSPLLPANERRRTTPAIRLALKVAEEASDEASRQDIRSVFASSSGDMDIIECICDALAQAEKFVSPTQFHNSVHNAPAGYWSIATANPAQATALSGFTETFAAGLLQAGVLQQAEGGEVLLVAYDVASGPVMLKARPVQHPFAVALRLGPAGGTPWRLVLEPGGAGEADTCSDPALEALRLDNPAARALPLLQRLAGGQGSHVKLPAPLGRLLHIELHRDD